MWQCGRAAPTHSDALHVTERFRRTSARFMEVEMTIDHAKAYARPWTVKARFESVPNADLGEHVCAVAPADDRQ